MQSLTQGVLDELNQCRRDPQRYSQKIQEKLQYFNGLQFRRPGDTSILITKEGAPAVIECVESLRSLQRLPELTLSLTISKASEDHCKDLGQSGSRGHTGTDGSSPSDRLRRYGQIEGSSAENISYGAHTAENIVINLLVDDGVPSRGHRVNILNPNYLLIGIAIGNHNSQLRTVCVMNFAQRFEEHKNQPKNRKQPKVEIRNSPEVRMKESPVRMQVETESRAKLEERKMPEGCSGMKTEVQTRVSGGKKTVTTTVIYTMRDGSTKTETTVEESNNEMEMEGKETREGCSEYEERLESKEKKRRDLIGFEEEKNRKLREICQKFKEELEKTKPDKQVLEIYEEYEIEERDEIISSEFEEKEGKLEIVEEIEVLKEEENRLKQEISKLISLISDQVYFPENQKPNLEEEKSQHTFNEDSKENLKNEAEKIIQNALTWEPLLFTDDYRLEQAYSSGGIALMDNDEIKKIRSVGKEIILELGRKILNGDFNLTKISFPIKCMAPRSALHNTLNTCLMFPLYLNKAASLEDHLERFKLTITASLSSFMYTSTFTKPLNPILGETLFGHLPDGALLWAEQSSHHPPISHFYVEGPNETYKVHGYYNFSAKAGLNSITIANNGKKTFCFMDGQIIVQNCPNEIFSGTFMGTMRHESLGNIEFSDENFRCVVNLGGIRRKASDYIETKIEDRSGRVLSVLTGTYLGYLDFDEVRYWDARYIEPFDLKFEKVLPSDADYREDLDCLKRGEVEEAQRAKEYLEELQRADRRIKAAHGFPQHWKVK